MYTNIKVENAPPKKPSNVLFGLSLIKGVFPNDLPQTYAKQSLIATVTGTYIAQNAPRKYCCEISLTV
jgi:hypothetical protein